MIYSKRNFVSGVAKSTLRDILMYFEYSYFSLLRNVQSKSAKVIKNKVNQINFLFKVYRVRTTGTRKKSRHSTKEQLHRLESRLRGIHGSQGQPE